MNLQLNLLHVSERRRPGGMLVVALLRLATFAIVGVVLLALAQAAATHADMRRQEQAAEAHWKSIEQDFARAQAVQAECDTLRRTLGELEAFSNVQVRVAERLRTLAALVPDAIQLTELSWRHDPASVSNAPARRCCIKICGCISGTNAADEVRDFIEALRNSPAPVDFGAVAAGSFGLASLDAASEQKYLFEVGAAFDPRRFQ